MSLIGRLNWQDSERRSLSCQFNLPINQYALAKMASQVAGLPV